MPFAPRVFSGMQPTGNLHLGNYLGALQRWVEMQNTHECIYCIVDMHAITVWQNPAELRQAIRDVTAAYIAAGLDTGDAGSNSEGLGAVGAYRSLSSFTKLGGTFTVFALPNNK